MYWGDHSELLHLGKRGEHVFHVDGPQPSAYPSYLLVVEVNISTVDRKESVGQSPTFTVEWIVVTVSSSLEPGSSVL